MKKLPILILMSLASVAVAGCDSFEAILKNYTQPITTNTNENEDNGDDGDETVYPESIVLEEYGVELKIGDTYQILPTVLPSNAINKDVHYTTSDEEVCSVSDEGLVTALGEGGAIISIISEEKSDVYAYFAATVLPDEVPPTPVTNYTVRFNANGGNGVMQEDQTDGSDYVLPECEFTRDKHTFSKWALGTTDGEQYSPNEKIEYINSDITLYAIWTADSTPINPNDYYASTVGLEGQALLNALRALNKTKRKSTVGYSAMGTSPAGQFKYTDYDPTTVKYEADGTPYGTSITSFYSETKTNSFNREHVWPNTHGGNLVESDIHMTRPTLNSENGSRGHSFYVEGMKSKSNEGWDPAMESFGKESYRGDSARIIFYCMIATDQLTLVDDQSRSHLTKNKEMGVISDMLKWNLKYEVAAREQRRNEGAEHLQGNRNPFIDHPEFACKIWKDFNSKTQQICGGNY